MNQKSSDQGRAVTANMFEHLPESVKRYMTYSQVEGKPLIRAVHLEQSGRFRQGLDKPWMPMAAQQTYTIDPPSFVWNASFKIAGLPLLRARDAYVEGRGHMVGKLAGLFTVFDVRGEELNQGAMLRYLSEMIWFPTAFLGRNISWIGIDDNSAEVTLTDGGRSVSAQMHFDDQGRPINFTADRYREIDGHFSLDRWSTPITGYDVIAELNLPVRGQAVWNLPEGDLHYIDLEITALEYNSQSPN